ncbi:MAG: cellulase family glycosylhydrolase [Chloroflexota bacterium]
MTHRYHVRRLFFTLIGVNALLFACLLPGLEASPSSEVPDVPGESESVVDKWSLWSNGTQLRGANIYQRRVFPEFDGTEFLGPGPFGPPYTQDDFDRLAALGANYVNISTAGLFTVEPPYVADEEAVASLDGLLEMAAAADLFGVITFRTGPGRSEFAIIGGGDWLPDGYIIETVWTDEAARSAWAEMWRYTAERYRDYPIVIGYDLMCEPNSNASLDIWDPETFYAQYAGTGYDWNAWYPDLVSAIRQVDGDTPILVGGNSYSDVEWLSYLQPVDDPHVVYTFHQYSPHEYTHQEPPDLTRAYPGYFDTNYDGDPETFDRAWLENLLAIAADFQSTHQVGLAVNEYGLERWEPGGADYVSDEMALFEQYGWNYAAWQWQPAWPPLAEGDNSFNFRFGPDPADLTEVPNDLLDAYAEAWRRNTVRPSNLVTAIP